MMGGPNNPKARKNTMRNGRGAILLVLTASLICVRVTGAEQANLPEHGAVSRQPARHWEGVFVTGNGRMGAMLFGDTARDTLIGNHCRLFAPLGNRELVPELSAYVPELRRIIWEKGYGAAMGFFRLRHVLAGWAGASMDCPSPSGLPVACKTDKVPPPSRLL